MPRKNFYIPQIDEDEELEESSLENTEEKQPKKKYVSDGFVSSIYGKNVKDDSYYPGVKYGNGGRQYDSFRDKDKRVNMDDFKDYIIQTDPNQIYNKNNNQNNNEFYQSPKKEVKNEFYREEVPSFEEEEVSVNDIYYNEPVKKEEYVNVRENDYFNNQNDYNNQMNNGYQNNYNNQNAYNNQMNNGYQNNYNNQNSYNNQMNNGYQNNYNNQNNYNAPQQNPYYYSQEQDNNNPNYNNYNNQNSYNNSERISVVVDNDRNNQGYSKPAPMPHQQYIQEKQINPRRKAKYVAPPLAVLKSRPEDSVIDESDTINQRNIIELTLKQFGIGGKVVNYTKGPTVTLFEILLDDGVRLQRIVPIQANLQGNLKATSLRMQIPIPGKGTIGVEVPNVKRDMVYFGDMIKNKSFLNDNNPMNVVLGVNIGGDPVYLDLSKMPHGLIAGSTGSGKSVCINAIISSILYKAHPDDVKLILVDPKRVEFSRYSGIPHLATPIITEPKMANAALKWAVDEMENRYKLFEATGVTKYTEYLDEVKTDARLKHIPYIVIIIDELADLMVTTGAEVEESIMRITQKARAAGIHLIVATQRPSVNIISGTIKTNIPTRIAFKVNKSVDSSIILDHTGAEKLLGNGDMLYTDDMGVENRIQGAYISGPEIKDVVASLENNYSNEYLFTEEDLKKKTMVDHSDDALNDELFEDIARYVVENETASINLLQKKFSCGFSRIQAIIIKLGELGVVSENMGSRARTVLVTPAELDNILNNI